MTPWAHRWALCLISLPYGALFLLKDQMYMMAFLPSSSLIRTKVHWLSSSWASIYFLMDSTKSSLSSWMVAFLKVKVQFPSYMLETRGLLNLGGLSGYDLALSSWWISLATKIFVSWIMDLLLVVDTDAKMETSSNIFGMPLISCFSWILLLHLST